MKNTSSQRSQKAAQGREGEVSTTQQNKRHELILLGTDTHGQQYTFGRKIDNQGCQPPQQLSPAKFLEFLQKQVTLAERVVMVYEAGPFGYALYRQATKLGVECLVCAPEKLSRGRNRTTDKIDAGELTSRLDRYVAGNTTALRPVLPPTLEQEMRRRAGRERDTYRKERQRWIGRGRSLLHCLGVTHPGRWWELKRREQLRSWILQQYGQATLEQCFQELDRYQELMEAMAKKLSEMTAAICPKPEKLSKSKGKSKDAAKEPKAPRIKGIGVLSDELLNREILDWNRFSNRRQIASYTGLCAGEASSGESQMHLSIDKHGNPRVRALLVELAWLLPRFQPDYIRLKRWMWVFAKGSKVGRAMRKKAIVALARQLAVDLWRMKTGRSTPEKLGLKLAA
jgi:transposase